MLVTETGESERRGKRYGDEREPFRIRHAFPLEDGESQDSDDERVVQVYRIGLLSDPFEWPVVEQPADFFRVRYGEKPDSKKDRNEREPVRSRRPRIREVVGFANGPKEMERPKH